MNTTLKKTIMRTNTGIACANKPGIGYDNNQTDCIMAKRCSSLNQHPRIIGCAAIAIVLGAVAYTLRKSSTSSTSRIPAPRAYPANPHTIEYRFGPSKNCSLTLSPANITVSREDTHISQDFA